MIGKFTHASNGFWAHNGGGGVELELIGNSLNQCFKSDVQTEDKHVPMTFQAMAFYISYLCNHNIAMWLWN